MPMSLVFFYWLHIAKMLCQKLKVLKKNFEILNGQNLTKVFKKSPNLYPLFKYIEGFFKKCTIIFRS